MFVDESNALTVSQLNGFIKDVLGMGFPQPVWVCGEVQGYNRNKDKSHVFFELCEKDPASHAVVARVGLVIFSGRRQLIEDILARAENAFQLKDDIEVKFLCKVDFYPPHGSVRLVVESIDPAYTLGKIAQEKQRLIALLKGKGVLDQNKQLELSPVPLAVGLITAYDSAAYNDFISELRLSGCGFKVFCRNTLMQGKKTQEDVCRALDFFYGRDDIDVIVITRGGGSIAELSCFDSQMIAEKIAAAPVPVISGIGHEINITITDLAAFASRKTPTAVARCLVERVAGFMADLNARQQTLLAQAAAVVAEARQSLSRSAVNLGKHGAYFLKYQHQSLARFEKILAAAPVQALQKARQRLSARAEDLTAAARAYLRSSRDKIDHGRRLLVMADPQHMLKRGFSLTRGPDGRVIKNVSQALPGRRVTTELRDGTFISTVNAVYKEDERGGDEIQ